MTKKYEERSTQHLLEIMGYDGNTEIEGASEIDIIYSGLEEIMCSAVKQNWDYAVRQNLSFRDACLVSSIHKVYKSYKENGLMI